MKQINYKKLILPNIPYVFFVYLFDKVGQAVRLAPGADISAKILNITQGFSAAFENALPSVYPLDLLVGIVGAVIIRLIVYVKGKNAKKYRKGAEYGSARWGNAEDIKPYIDPDFQNNIILTQTERLTMNSRPKQPKYARNKNVVVIGGSGSGKTRFFVKPNLMQLHSSYVLTDPKGTVLIECGKLLQRAGYRIKVLNTINFKKSMHYNPFVYIRSEKDILKLVNTIIVNTAKGLEAGTLKTMTQVEKECFPENTIALLTGPSHAEEVARGIPTTVCTACEDRDAANFIQQTLSNDTFRVYVNDDVMGCEIGGSLKNVIALAAGVCDGLGLGDNTKAALMTRGIREIARLGIAMGADSATFAGLSGIGDLIVTCCSMHSRNRRAGILIGQGVDPAEAVRQVGTVEGYTCTKNAYELAKKIGVEMPITEQLAGVLFNGTPVKDTIKKLMGRPSKNETENEFLS